MVRVVGLTERLAEVVVHQLADLTRQVGEDHAVGGQVLGPPALLLLVPLALDLLVQPDQGWQVVVVLGVRLLAQPGVALAVNLHSILVTNIQYEVLAEYY